MYICVSSCPHILYADGKVSLEMVKVFRQLVTMVIVGEQALKKRQQLEEKKTVTKWRQKQEGMKTAMRRKTGKDEQVHQKHERRRRGRVQEKEGKKIRTVK